MELIRGLHNIRPRHRGCVLTIGNFDGVHTGHQAVIAQLREIGEQMQLPSTLVTFEPQPLEYFAGLNAPPRLTRFKEKMRELEKTPVQRVLVLHFNQKLAQMSAEDFVEQVLVSGLGAKVVIAGEDFRFGRDAYGNMALLERLGGQAGFTLMRREKFEKAGGRVSSSWIRDALANAELTLVNRLLGRPYSMMGRVVHGKRLGRTIGYPTANILPRRLVCPVAGIYVVALRVANGPPLPGVASVGTRPTVNGEGVLLEVYLFDFEGDLYGKEVCVEFLEHVRDELRFDSLAAMTERIDSDAAHARAYFESRSGAPTP